MPKKYCPYNGTEGIRFMEIFCDRCDHLDINPVTGDIKKDCDIVLNTMAYDIDDPEYPEEWTYDKDGKPTCTKFREKGMPWGNTFKCSACNIGCVKLYVKPGTKISRGCLFGSPLWEDQGETDGEEVFDTGQVAENDNS